MAKKFFYVCGGLLMLAMAFHFGSVNATAQSTNQAIVALATNANSPGGFMAVNTVGDAFFTNDGGRSWTFNGNVYGSPIPTVEQSWGQVKARYR